MQSTVEAKMLYSNQDASRGNQAGVVVWLPW